MQISHIITSNSTIVFPETLSIYLSEYANNMEVGYLSRVFSLPDSHYGVNFSH